MRRVVERMPLPLRKVLTEAFTALQFAPHSDKFKERSDRQEFFRRAFKALAFNVIDGDYAEFGCHGGGTFDLAYYESRCAGYACKLWAFDSFSGLPAPKVAEDQHPQWFEGNMRTGLSDFHRICKHNGIPRSSYEVVPGYYDTTLSGRDSSITVPSNICMAYIDCDLYSSTMTVLKFLLPRLKHGMIIAFDDYYCWSSTQLSGERRSCSEVFDNNEEWRLLPYVQFGWGGLSFVVESRKLNGQPNGNASKNSKYQP